ncbi:MAG TPA: hypothetical protein VGK67_09520 [Myxococcales bacterium]|jgi:hypothetical protein
MSTAMNPALLLLLPALLSASPRFKAFTAKGDGFSVEFPGNPDVELEKGAEGILRRAYSVLTEYGGSLLVRVVTVAEGGGASAKALDLDEVLRAEGGEAKESKTIALGGLEGREVSLEAVPLDKLVRVYHGKRQLFLAAASYPHGTKLDPEIRRRFFNSFKIFGVAPEDQARPADGIFATIEDLKVVDREEKKAHEVHVEWTAVVNVEPGDSAVTLGATCRCGGKVSKASYPVRVGPGKKGQRVRMSQTLNRMRGEVAHCDLSFGWGAAGKPHEALYRACWPGPEAELYAGPCE